MRDHGGDLEAAREKFGGAACDWIDLSTGINPVPYPIPDLPLGAWTRLPERTQLMRLESVAQRRYETDFESVALAGAQGAIQLIPQLHPVGKAGVLMPTYNEHAASLRSFGWQVVGVSTLEALKGYDIAVVVNPNNPDGQRHAPDALIKLADHVGLLVVDESFADPEPRVSVVRAGALLPRNVIVLRSFGKFYGLAGIRLGFALSAPKLAGRLRELAGPWPVSGLAVSIGCRALDDLAWSRATTVRLIADAARLDRCAINAGWRFVGGTPLFRTYDTGNAVDAHNALGRGYIWSRIFPYSQRWIRLGLPANEVEWARLSTSLQDL